MPLTLKILTPVTVSVVASPNTALPVIVSELAPPTIVPFVVIVEPCNVRSAPEKVTLPA